MKKLLLSLLFTAGLSIVAQAQIFTQNFSGTAVVSDYVDAAGASNKFTAIGSGSNNIASITGNALQFAKTGSGTAHFSQNASFSGPPTALKISFKFNVGDIAVTATTQAQLYVGTGFANTSGAPTLSSTTHSRLVIGFDETTGFNFSGPNAPTGATPFYNSAKIVTWVINNTGSTLSYSAPNGSTKTLIDDSWDLYVDEPGAPSGTPVLAARGTQSPTLAIDQFFFRYDSASQNATITFDDFLINDQATVLPVELTSLTAKANLQNVDLAWFTASEASNSHFDVLRSTDGKVFTKIGEVKGNGTTTIAKNYRFTDRNALPGVSYYQLKQVDLNGVATISAAVAVKSNVAANNFKITSNKQDGTLKLSVLAANDGQASFKIYDLNGRKLSEQTLTLTKGYNNISVHFNGSAGLHVAALTTETATITQKFIQ